MTQPTRLFDFPYFQLKNRKQETSFATKVNGEWVRTSTEELIRKINIISRALLKLGVKRDDKIALITSNNRTAWNIMDFGILQIGAQNVPIYPNISTEDYLYILNNSETKYCIVSDKEVHDKLLSIKDQLPNLIDIYSFDEIEGCKNWKELLELGADTSNQDEVDKIKDSINEDCLATLIYTSGTTGTPKGVMLSHKNIVSDVLGSIPRVPFTDVERFKSLSFLPICHIFERMIVCIYIYHSVTVYYAESIEKMVENIQEIKPNVVTVVPRLLEKIYDKIYTTGSQLTGIKKRVFFWSLELAEQYLPYKENGWWYEFKLSIARKLVFKKWQEALGGEIALLVSGSAALQPRLTRIFTAAGIPIMEGYGLTEAAPVISVNDMRNGGFRIGTVGRILDNVEVKFAEDGEILCKGPNVMLGYYKDEEKTNEAIVDGYLCTGDIGELDKDGFLMITDRKKEMFKTSGGKYVAPQIIENTMKESRFIEQIMVIGEGEKMPAAFIQPNFIFIEKWAERKNIDIGKTNEEIIANQKVIDRIAVEVEKINKRFGNWEQVKRFELTPDVWAVETGHLTPTLKLKRRILLKMYKDLYDKIYR